MRALALALVLLLAGCAGAPSAPASGTARPAPADWAQRVLSWPEGHDHANVSQHAGLSTPNFEIVGYDPLLSEYFGNATPAGYICGDAQPTATGRSLAVVESRSDLGFAVADVTDAAHPKWLGEIVMRSTYVYDVAVVPDGKHVVAVTSQAQTGGILRTLAGGHGQGQGQGALAWRDACNGRVIDLQAPMDPIPRPASILLIDITDPHDPQIVDQRPLAGYGHSVRTFVVDGRTWIVASATSTAGADTISFYDLLDTPLGARLDLLSTYAPPAAQSQVAPNEIGGHDDAAIAKHPITGQTLGYVVNRRDVSILDLADPRQPKLLSQWSDWRPEREGFSANMHSVWPIPSVWSGHQYTVVAPEWTKKPEHYPTGIAWILDTTDPTKPHEVAAWTLPYESEWSGDYMFSTHYLAVQNKTLFVSAYHGGIWAVDLSGIEGHGQGPGQGLALLPSVGVFMPDRVSPKPPEKAFRWTPTTEEVIPQPDGSMVTFDSNSGLYTIRFDAAHPAPAPPPYPIEPLSH